MNRSKKAKQKIKNNSKNLNYFWQELSSTWKVRKTVYKTPNDEIWKYSKQYKYIFFHKLYIIIDKRFINSQNKFSFINTNQSISFVEI